MVSTSADLDTVASSAPLSRAAVALAEFHAQRLGIIELLAALQTSVLLAPVADDRHLLVGRLTGEGRGVTWVPTFSSEDQLKAYVVRRREADQPWRYRRIPGELLLGAVLDQLPRPCGLAIDVAGQYPLLLPQRRTPARAVSLGREGR
jgi:hypothetical protein